MPGSLHALTFTLAVLDKLGNSFQRVALRQGNDPDCVPVIANSQLTLRFRSTCHSVSQILCWARATLGHWYREITAPVQPNRVHHDQPLFQKVDPRFTGRRTINRFIELVLCMSQCRGGNGDIPGHSKKRGCFSVVSDANVRLRTRRCCCTSNFPNSV
jgi:hypothetical protein